MHGQNTSSSWQLFSQKRSRVGLPEGKYIGKSKIFGTERESVQSPTRDVDFADRAPGNPRFIFDEGARQAARPFVAIPRLTQLFASVAALPRAGR